MLKSIFELLKSDFIHGTKYFRKSSLKYWFGYFKNHHKFKTKILLRPSLKKEESHTIHKHYFHQDLWVAEQVLAQSTLNIADVGSRIDGYVAHIACHQKIDFYDITKPNLSIKNIVEFKADLITGKGMPNQKYDVVTCLHVLEHLGLGRYDNVIDELAYKMGLTHLYNMLKPGGLLYISAPCSGTKRIEYNQHQVFTPTELLEWNQNEFTIKALCAETDKGSFHSDITKSEFIKKLNNCWYGLGIVVLQRK